NEDGKEEIRVETAQGQMRAILSKTGVELINELAGGIELSGKKINLKGKNITVVAEKSLSMNSDGPANFKEKGKFTLTSDKDVTLKGKNIKMSGSKGVAAEGKQIAVQDDKVMGFDVHIMVVPSGNGTTTVPLPHPFIGKLADKLSKDVKIKDKACATKDSVAKHDDSMHMQLPGTIKFQNNPKKEGNVTGGTSPKVKINGKEAAVIGSQVSTCNDVGAQNNSTVIAPGASMPMPVIINPKNTEEWKREQEEKEKKEPKFSDVKWANTSVDEGKEVELTASVQDIEDGNMVTLQVFPEGKGPEDGVPITSFPLTVKGGSVSAKWSYHANKSELPQDSDPKFVFSAHCAWCNFEKSSNSVEVKLVRPEITKAEWQNKDGGSTSKGLVGETLKLHAETKDMEGGVTFRIYDDKGRQVFEKGAEIEGDKAEAEWTYHWNGEKLEEKPKFTFEVTGQRCKKVESSEVDISATFEAVLQNQNGEILKDLDYAIIQSDGSTSDSKTDDNGIIKVEDVIPGIVEVKVSFEDIESSYIVNFSTEESNSNDEIILQPNEKTLLASKPINVNKKIIFIFYTEELDVSE
uniref:PAAR domain-containing protein n=1 Tax=Treponema sp. TaxID=166 RepID=UPI0025E7AEB3